MQEYLLKDFKVSDFKDNYGNTWCDASFGGIGEPVKWVVKDPTKPTLGQSYYGEVKEMTSKAGKPYLRFYKQEKPEAPTQSGQTDEYWAERNNTIRAQFAIKTAVELLKDPKATDITEELIEDWAKKIFKMVDRVAGGEEDKQEAVEVSEDDLERPIDLNDIPY